MSSADPGRARARRPLWIYPLAAVVALVLVGSLLLPLGVAAVWRRVALGAQAPGSVQSAHDGSNGLGDPYYPRAGNGGYDVERYEIQVSWDPTAERLTGTTTISARALQGLHSFDVDLALTASRVTVDGQDAGLAKDGASDWRITPATPVPADQDFTVVVTYDGQPGTIGDQGASPYYKTGDEVLIAGEPQSAAWWYPSNDHPSDPALMDVSIRVPHGLQAISIGRLVSADTGTEADWDTWHWASQQPTATYLSFMAVGSFTLQQGTADGIPYVYAVTNQLPAASRATAFTALQTSGAKIKVLSGLFGAYPFSELGGIVVAASGMDFDGLETQTRPIYRASAILDARYSDELLAHELAHMWFGDNVTLRQWNDIFDNEAYASWAAWAVAERTGGPTAQKKLDQTYAAYRGDQGFWRVTMIDPGRRNLFTTVYVRGPMALQALHNVMGDAAFTRLNTQWAQDPGTRSLEEWMARAQSLTPTDLTPFFQAWIYAPTVPLPTPTNGLA